MVLCHALIRPELIHSFIIFLLFSSKTTSRIFEVLPLTLSLLKLSFQKSGSLFSVSILISSCCKGSREL
jgi:hypothetical protein